MVFPKLRAAVLGEELRTLGGDDGGRLAQLLWQLRQERRSDPNLITRAALTNALALAGHVDEARVEAWQAYELAASLPAVAPQDMLNVVAGLGESGYEAAARELLGKLEGRPLGERDEERRTQSAMNLALRFGDLAWFAANYPKHPALRFLETRHLDSDWSAQQREVEALLAGRVSAFGSELVKIFDEGTERLVLDYWTDARSFGEVEALQVELLELLDAHGRLYQLVPDVVFQVHGPQVPLEALLP